MIPEFGVFTLILAFFISILQGALSLIGAQTGRKHWIVLARPAAQVLFLLLLCSFLSLVWAFASNDFSVIYVVQHSNVLLPLAYRIGAVWGGHEGSLLLWVLLLSGWTFSVGQLSKNLDEVMAARVIGILGLVSSGLLLFIIATSNPFERIFPAEVNGRDLNPLLQDPGLVFHPPMLYMGYVGFSVAFAFAIASLLSGKLDAAWARWSRPWTIAAWVFLTLGIALGSWWAYYELGWGGWWFWDPVENASFMPWLVGTALLHSLTVTEKRGAFKNWTVLLAIITFSLSLLGTFLVRSGVLTSVHAFATDPRRGVFILVLLCLVVGSSLILYAVKTPRTTLGGMFNLISRETFILLGNVFLVVACASVLLGTIYPLLLDALNLGKISVGPPYFNSVFVPIISPVLLLMGIGPLAKWKNSSTSEIIQKLWGAAISSVVAAILIPIVMGEFNFLAGVGFFLSFWLIGSITHQIIRRLKIDKPPRSYWAMQTAHLGIAVFVIGVTMVGSYQQEKDVRMEPGDVVTVGGYEIKLLGIQKVDGPNYDAIRGSFDVTKNTQKITTLFPEKRSYFSSSMPMTEAAIDVGVTRDIYIALGDALEGSAWAVRVYYKPFVDWIWGGCLLMALGGIIAISDRRYRMKLKPSKKDASQ